jgi:hypothetical protein
VQVLTSRAPRASEVQVVRVSVATGKVVEDTDYFAARARSVGGAGSGMLVASRRNTTCGVVAEELISMAVTASVPISGYGSSHRDTNPALRLCQSGRAHAQFV